MASPATVTSKRGSSAVVHAREGHVAARYVPHLRYVAFDVHLRGPYVARMADAKEALVSAVRSRRTSSYRFVTRGSFEADDADRAVLGPPSAETDRCDAASDDGRGGGDAASAPTPPRTLRREKPPEAFDAPKPATLHSYESAAALEQFRGQESVGGQMLLQLEVVPFWRGEDVVVRGEGNGGTGRRATIADFNGETDEYDVVYDDRDVRMSTHQGSGRIVRRERVKEVRLERVDGRAAAAGLASVVERLWEAADYDYTMESVERGEVNYSRTYHEDLGRDGMTLAYGWTEGTAVVSWDGGRKVVVDFFVTSAGYAYLWETAARFRSDLHVATVESRGDIFPRGTESVVNFSEFIQEDELPVWV